MTAAGIIGANPLNAHERKPYDFYPTPPEVTHALVSRIPVIARQRVWEPACGDGAMVRVLESRGAKVAASDVRETSVGVVHDFLADFGPDEGPEIDWIITNPPFQPAAKFIEKCLHLKTCEKYRTLSFAFLLKSTYWHSKKRLGLFNKAPPSWVLPLTWRPAFFGKRARKVPAYGSLLVRMDAPARANRNQICAVAKAAKLGTSGFVRGSVMIWEHVLYREKGNPSVTIEKTDEGSWSIKKDGLVVETMWTNRVNEVFEKAQGLRRKGKL